jgi:hypothetical protein
MIRGVATPLMHDTICEDCASRHGDYSMAFPFNMRREKCGTQIGTIISPAADHLAPLKLEFACPECIEKTARSNAITLDQETSWGKVIAERRGRV